MSERAQLRLAIAIAFLEWAVIAVLMMRLVTVGKLLHACIGG